VQNTYTGILNGFALVTKEFKGKGSELELEPDHFDSAPALKNDSAPAPTPVLRPVLSKIYCISF
jgi:hypothetical protein